MPFKLSKQDMLRLEGVHPDLVQIVIRAAEMSTVKFTVLEGLRSIERQKTLVAKGASKTMKSRHIRAGNGFGHAVDIAPVIDGQTSWDWKHYHPLAKIMKDAAKAVGINVEWGGDWKGFPDGPHWQLSWAEYPGKTSAAVSFVDLSNSRTVQGSSAAVAGGGYYLSEGLTDLQTKMEQAQYQFSAGDVISITIGAVILVGALYALYARWDDAGRPLPFKRNRTAYEDIPEPQADFTEMRKEGE